MDLRQGRPSDSQEPVEGPLSGFKASLSSTGTFKLHTGNFPGLTFCTLFPNQEMGKSLSAQEGGDLTETLALGFWTWRGLPISAPCFSVDVEVGGSCPRLVGSRENSGCGLGSWFFLGGRDLACCVLGSLWLPGFPWWLLQMRCHHLTRIMACRTSCSSYGSLQTKPHTCHPLSTTSRGSQGLSSPQLPLSFGIQIWILGVHQEAGSVHFN